MSYRMSYVMPRPGPPKAKEELGEDEGLTDHLLVVSILGTPGGPGDLSLMPLAFGPEGVEPLTSATALAVAAAMLSRFEHEDPAAAAGMGAIRKVVLARRS